MMKIIINHEFHKLYESSAFDIIKNLKFRK